MHQRLAPGRAFLWRTIIRTGSLAIVALSLSSASVFSFEPKVVTDTASEGTAIRAVLDIDDPPLTIEPFSVFTPVARAAAVIYVEHGDPAASPVLD